MHLSGLFLYPVKSLRGCAVDAAEVDAFGIVGDRRFLIVDETGLFLTQRTLPKMARVSTALTPDELTLSADGAGSIRIPRAPSSTARLLPVSVWKSRDLPAEDCGDLTANWLSDFLGAPCRLVRIGPAFQRPVLKSTATVGDQVNFADAFPFLVLSEASLADLNRRLGAQSEAPVPMNRFRPNFVVSGCSPFAEDTWRRLSIGSVMFRAGGPCARCIVTTIDQLSGERGKEPLHALSLYRRDPAEPTNVNFGQNLIQETKTGTVRINDPVQSLA